MRGQQKQQKDVREENLQKDVLVISCKNLRAEKDEEVLLITKTDFQKIVAVVNNNNNNDDDIDDNKLEKRRKHARFVCFGIQRARALLRLKRFEECLQVCNQILVLRPNFVLSNWLKSRALLSLGGVYEARILLYKARKCLVVKEFENERLNEEIMKVEETCKHALPDDPQLRVEKVVISSSFNNKKKNSEKNVMVTSNIKTKNDDDADTNDESDKKSTEDDEEEDVIARVVVDEKTDFAAKASKNTKKKSWADEVEEEEEEEEETMKKILTKPPLVSDHNNVIVIPMVSLVHLAIENNDATEECTKALKRYGQVRVALPDETFDISLTETLEKTIKCFEKEYLDDANVMFFASAWELDVDEEEVVQEESKSESEEEEEVVEIALKSASRFSYANIAKKNARKINESFNAAANANDEKMFPPLVNKNQEQYGFREKVKESSREWNEPELCENDDHGSRLQTIFPSDSFKQAVADATQVLEIVSRRVITSILRQMFPNSEEHDAVLCNLEGPSEEFVQRARKEKYRNNEAFTLHAKSGLLVAREDDEDLSKHIAHENNDDTLFLTCEWLFDPKSQTKARGVAGGDKKSKSESRKFFTSNVELDGPIVRFIVGPALRKKYSSLNFADCREHKLLRQTTSSTKVLRFSLFDEDA